MASVPSPLADYKQSTTINHSLSARMHDSPISVASVAKIGNSQSSGGFSNSVAKPSAELINKLLNNNKSAAPKQQTDILSKLGIQHSSTTSGSRDSILKAVVIKGLHGTSWIVLRCEPVDPNGRYGSWSEKVFFEAIWSKPQWVLDCGLHDEVLQWVHNGIPMKNNKGYNVRLFFIKCDNTPQDSMVLEYAQIICAEINQTPKNNTTLLVDEHNFFWIPTDAKPVWRDVVGADKALEMLLDQQPWSPKYYQNNKNLVHIYFAPGTLSLDLAKALEAPMDQVHPGAQADFFGSNVEERSKEDMQVEEQQEDGAVAATH